MTRNKAKAFINSLLYLRETATDKQAIEAPAVYPEWKSEAEYIIDNRVVYNNILYRVITTHTSQETWTPDVSVSLFAKVLIPDEDVIPAWEQPDSTNAYKIGDEVTHNGKNWMSMIDNNVWEPGVYGWTEI